MAIGTAAAILGSAVIGAGASIYGSSQAAKAAEKAGRQQQAGIERGVNETKGLYEEGQGYLKPYVDAGATYKTLLDDIVGVNGPEAQAKALEMYKSSPSASLLDAAREDVIRRTNNEFAASGGANSGSRLTELGKRTAELDLANYYNWENIPKGIYNTGANAAGAAANLANSRSAQVLGARTGQGTALASGTIGAANANLAGLASGTNYLQNLLGRASTMDLSKPSGVTTGSSTGYLPNYSWTTGSGAAAP